MKSPWTKKNPWLSMYLSGANAVAGAMRAQTAAFIRQSTAAAVKAGFDQLEANWSRALSLPPAPRKKKGGRR
jgi:hypothetical protein